MYPTWRPPNKFHPLQHTGGKLQPHNKAAWIWHLSMYNRVTGGIADMRLGWASVDSPDMTFRLTIDRRDIGIRIRRLPGHIDYEHLTFSGITSDKPRSLASFLYHG